MSGYNWIKTVNPEELKKEYKKIIPIIRQTAREYGYAVGVHGSLKRDLDLIVVPWISKPKSHKKMIKAVQLAISKCYEKNPVAIKRPHGRIAYIIHIGRKAYIDMSIFGTTL